MKALILILLFTACVEFPTDSIQTGAYNGNWIGNVEGNILQLNIQHEYSGTHGIKLSGNGQLYWLGILWAVDVDNPVVVDGLLTCQIIIRDANGDQNTDYVFTGYVREKTTYGFSIYLDRAISQTFKMSEGTWNFPKKQLDIN